MGVPIGIVINPHQRCGCSDSPFARKDTFLYCRAWKWVEMGWRGVDSGGHTHKKKLYLRKYWKNMLRTSNRMKKRYGSCGIDNEGSWSCKRRVSEDFVQNA